MNKNLLRKMGESLFSVLPITAIVLLLHFTIAPIPSLSLGLFLVGAVLLVLGMGLFTLGADLAMMPMGEAIGAHMTKSRKIFLLIGVSFALGTIITMAEPDLQILARQVPAVPDFVLIAAVALGVGLFLVAALLRILFQIKLAYILMGCYTIIFVLMFFVPEGFLAVAFDSGGVTTGPITVPFIMALGIGVAAVRGGKSSQDDSFGLIALCSVGPILAVFLLGLFFEPSGGNYAASMAVSVHSMEEVFLLFLNHLPSYLLEVGIALTPVIVFFIIFQITALKLPKRLLIKMGIGMLYTFLGLVLFLTAVNVGFMPIGNYLGSKIGSLPYNWVLIPLGMVIGFFIVTAEPAVHVLTKQVEEVSGGSIPKNAMLICLSIGVAISIGLAMTRIMTGTPIWYFLLPGYALALILTFFVPPIFTATAFDSGGVASGPMTATFLLPFAMGACTALGGNILTDAFGIVAMVAMTPLVTIQVFGLIYMLKTKSSASQTVLPFEAEEDIIDFDNESEGGA